MTSVLGEIFTGSALFQRDFKINVGGTVIATRTVSDDFEGFPGGRRTTLRTVFRVDRNNATGLNQAEITLYNLSDDSISRLDKDVFVSIEAGYVGETQELFTGDIDYVNTTFDRVDRVTRIEATDGGVNFGQKRVSKNFPPGTTIVTAINFVAQATGYGLGNLPSVLAAHQGRGGVSNFAKGFVAQGRAVDELKKLTDLFGLTFSIQSGQIQVLDRTRETNELAVRLAADSGLIGVPEIGENNFIKARSLLRGALTPGRRVVISSTKSNRLRSPLATVGSIGLEGTFKIQRVTHTGDSWGNDWYSDVEALQS